MARWAGGAHAEEVTMRSRTMDSRRFHISRRGLLGASLMAAAMRPLSALTVAAKQEKASLQIVTPTAGMKVTANQLDVTLKVDNFTIDGLKAGRPDEPGVGHIHLMFDGMTMAQLANFYTSDTFSVPLDGLPAGAHTIIVTLASNSHVDMPETAQKVEIDYQPANPVQLPQPNDQGTPSVELVSPKTGTAVEPRFAVEVRPVNITLAGNLEGKQNVPGYGHLHVFVDTPMSGMGMTGGMSTPEMEMGTPGQMMGTPSADGMGEAHMMSMAGMVLMPGRPTFDLDLTDWGPGEHTIWIEPVQNDHTQFADFGHVEFKVTVSG